MPSSPSRVFSLAEANELVPVVAELTADVVEYLETIRQRHELEQDKGREEMPGSVLKEVEHALGEWSEKIQQLGAHPKGYFTVDFQSIDPELLYCWTYGEDRIAYTHKVWENFAHRRPLSESAKVPSDHLKWVN